MRTPIITLTAAICGAGLAVAETAKQSSPTSIDTLVTQALAENPESRFYDAEIAVAKGEKRTAGAWQNPEISGELGAKRTIGDGLDAAGVVWAASVQQTFECRMRSCIFISGITDIYCLLSRPLLVGADMSEEKTPTLQWTLKFSSGRWSKKRRVSPRGRRRI